MRSGWVFLRRSVAGPALALALSAVPALAQGNDEAGAIVTVTRADLVADPATGRLRALVDLPDLSALPPVDPAAQDEAAGYLRRLVARGKAAGLQGVLYDNRDRGHSRLPPRRFPQLARIRYDRALGRGPVAVGLGGGVAFGHPVLGNSSTAFTGGPRRRSLPRFAMTMPGGAAQAYAAYAGNALYVYPEHNDHDAADLYPANWPYAVISQGSSYTDRPFLDALALTLAAFRPETRARLEATGLVAPTLQMILRRAQTGVRTRQDYLSPAAHPVVFRRQALQPVRMMALAQSLAADAIPPMVRLAVLSEDFTESAGLSRRSERLFDTPSAIARLWRSSDGQRQMVVSAAATRDPAGRPLQFSWVLLAGDPARVSIEPLDPAGALVRIRFGWHDPAALPHAAAPPGRRIDIGVFAWNGVADSAPAFVSVALPLHQSRIYAARADGGLRPVSIDYDALSRGIAYDPVLWWSAPWIDRYISLGTQPLGAIRIAADGGQRFFASASGPQAAHYRQVGAAGQPMLDEITDPGQR